MSTKVLQDSKFKSIISNLKFYDKDFPEINEYVIAKIIRYEETGIYCYLNEYKCEALLSFKDASSSKRLKNIKKQVKKGHSYILTVVGVDNIKGFIDVEKRSIDNDDQSNFEKLILFYEKVFNIFVKTFFTINPNCYTEDIYNFLKSTLWLQNPKLIQENLKDIHTNPSNIVEMYNLKSVSEGNILDDLSKIITKPSYTHIVNLDVKSISLNGRNDIISILTNISNEVEIPEFRVIGVPIYSSKIKTEFDPTFDPKLYSINITEKIESFIDNNKSNEYGIKIEEISYKLN